MGGGSKSPSSTTQTTRPFPAQEAALTRLFGLAEERFGAGPEQFFPSSTVAGQSPETLAGQQLALEARDPLATLGLESAGTASGLLRGQQANILADPNSIANAASIANLDPTSAQSQALINPLLAQLQGEILPSIGSRAIQQGAFGGSRQAIQEQEAAGAISEAATSAILRNQLQAQQALAGNIGAGLGQTRADIATGLSAIPTVGGALLEPSRITSQVGAQQEARQQALIDAARQRFQFQQQAPETALDRLGSRISGINLGQIGTSRSSGGGGGFDAGTAVGLGLVGASLL
jgi:hypothetical protein